MDEANQESGADPEVAAVEELVGEALAAFEAGGARAVDELLREHPGRAAAVRRRLARLERLGLLDAVHASDLPERVGEFVIEDVLAEGGMGVVYRARDESLGRAVALKVVRPELLLVPGARARIRREAEAAAQLHHPNVAALHRYGEQDGLPYLAMELVEGRSLSQVLDAVGGPDAPEPHGQRLIPGGPAAWTAACLQIGAEVARALAHAHERGVLHRDVKPSNILVDETGHARLVDFGLARMEGSGQLTRTGSQVGSLYYMAPEQLLERSANLDGRVDVYALGVTLYELLTRTSPFAGFAPEETIRRIREGHFERPRRVAPQLSRDVEAVLLQAMALDRERRYRDAAAFADELDNLVALRPIVARRPTTRARLRSWTRRRPRSATALILTALAALVLWGVTDWQQRESQRVLAEESTRTAAQTAAMGELLAELGLMLDDAVLDQDPARMNRIQDRLDAVVASAAALPEAGNGEPLAVANSRLTLATRSLVKGEFERTTEHVLAAREALEGLGDDAPAALVFRAHIVLCDLARKLDDPELRRQSWGAAQAAYATLERTGYLTDEDRLKFVHGAIDEATHARVAGDFARSLELFDLAKASCPTEATTRAERIAAARVWIESGRLAFDLQDLEAARSGVERATESLAGVEPDTTSVRSIVVSLARLDAELLWAAGDVAGAFERLARAERLVDPLPDSQADFEMKLRFNDLLLRLKATGGGEAAVDALLDDTERTCMELLERYGKFERARSIALLSLSNWVAVCASPQRIERGLESGRAGEAAWRAVAAEGETPLPHARMLLNLGSLHQDSGNAEAAGQYYAAADRVLERARSAGGGDLWIDRTRLAILANQGVLRTIRGELADAEDALDRARDLARSVARRTGEADDWMRLAHVSQELANVHMDSPDNAHSILVLEESLAEIEAAVASGASSPELEHERDWQGFSLVTQYLQAGSQARAIDLLRELLDRDTRDAELDARCAVSAAWAIRVGHAEVERDRALCAAWIERASAGAPDFAEQIDPRRAPWDRLANGESARPR